MFLFQILNLSDILPNSQFRIQEVDGSFFEKFGSLLQRSNEDDDVLRLAPMPGEDEVSVSESHASVSGAQMATMRTIHESQDPDSGTETMPESDSDQEPESTGEIVEGIIGGIMMNVSLIHIKFVFTVRFIGLRQKQNNVYVLV